MKTRIEYSSLNENSEPIVIENLKVFKNCVGQWTISFDTINHKYLEYEGTLSRGYFDKERFILEEGVVFETYETFIDQEENAWDSFMKIDSNGGRIGSFSWRNSDTRYGSLFGHMKFGWEPFELPNQKVEIFLIPETKEEENEINGTFCVLPLKWEYSIVCIPFEHFSNSKYSRSKEFEVIN